MRPIQTVSSAILCVFSLLSFKVLANFPMQNAVNYSYMTCRVGYLNSEGHISQIWYGQLWGPRNRQSFNLACELGRRKCLSQVYANNLPGKCLIIGKDLD